MDYKIKNKDNISVLKLKGDITIYQLQHFRQALQALDIGKKGSNFIIIDFKDVGYLDALALGKPVVATKAGGLPEIIIDGETGRLVEAANPTALARGIIEMLNRADLARQMAERGRKVVLENFSIESMIEKNLAVYRQILPESWVKIIESKSDN